MFSNKENLDIPVMNIVKVNDLSEKLQAWSFCKLTTEKKSSGEYWGYL